MQVFYFGKLALAECLSPLSLQNWKSSKCKEIPFRSHLSDKDYLNSIKTLLSTRLLLSKPPDQSSHTFWHLNVEKMLNPNLSLDFILNLMVKWYERDWNISSKPWTKKKNKRKITKKCENKKRLREICGSQYFFLLKEWKRRRRRRDGSGRGRG